MPTEDRETVQAGFRLTLTGRDLLRKLARAEGVTDTAYLEVTLRRLAREKGWAVDDDEKKESEAG